MIEPPVLFESKCRCAGCTACCQICPESAISMIPDNEGFLYPVIKRDRCIGCRRCIKVCPVRISAKEGQYVN